MTYVQGFVEISRQGIVKGRRGEDVMGIIPGPGPSLLDLLSSYLSGLADAWGDIQCGFSLRPGRKSLLEVIDKRIWLYLVLWKVGTDRIVQGAGFCHVRKYTQT